MPLEVCYHDIISKFAADRLVFLPGSCISRLYTDPEQQTVCSSNFWNRFFMNFNLLKRAELLKDLVLATDEDFAVPHLTELEKANYAEDIYLRTVASKKVVKWTIEEVREHLEMQGFRCQVTGISVKSRWTLSFDRITDKDSSYCKSDTMLMLSPLNMGKGGCRNVFETDASLEKASGKATREEQKKWAIQYLCGIMRQMIEYQVQEGLLGELAGLRDDGNEEENYDHYYHV